MSVAWGSVVMRGWVGGWPGEGPEGEEAEGEEEVVVGRGKEGRV